MKREVCLDMKQHKSYKLFNYIWDEVEKNLHIRSFVDNV